MLKLMSSRKSRTLSGWVCYGLGLPMCVGALTGAAGVASQQQSPSSTPSDKAVQTDQAQKTFGLPDGPGRELVIDHCSRCHTPDRVLAHGRSREGWDETIIQMVGFGATGSEEEFTKIEDYLTKYVPAASGPVSGPPTSASASNSGNPSLAPSPGQKIFMERCAVCHDAGSTETKVGPGLKGLYSRGKFTSDGNKITDDSLARFIHDGKGNMPPFKDVLNSGQMQDVVNYLKTL